ncbi:hypothetical protein H5410_017166 [Solanum commersonii]|uniref:Uncharacterized protein n=1 Tax=Solanum commersonii TaxID=4109 RepID=A0A9J5ZYC9_SOLCO|nr:hypothetical protein H5410_017166 [Solanum commersonii]
MSLPVQRRKFPLDLLEVDKAEQCYEIERGKFWTVVFYTLGYNGKMVIVNLRYIYCSSVDVYLRPEYLPHFESKDGCAKFKNCTMVNKKNP